MAGKAVDFRETLVTYLNSGCELGSTAHALGIQEPALRQRLNKLKKLGVKVPSIRSGRKGPSTLEVAQMNSLINKWKGEGQE